MDNYARELRYQQQFIIIFRFRWS